MVAFPRKTVAIKAEEQSALRWLVRQMGWYGAAVGVLARLYRWVVLTVLVPHGTQHAVIELGFGAALICALAAVHLANFTLRRWWYHAPVLGAAIALGESGSSLLLTFVHQERLGRGVATIADWPTTALRILETRVLLVSVFALALAGVVALLRAMVDTDRNEKRGTGNEET